MGGKQGQRTVFAQNMVEETNKRQRQYVLDRLGGMSLHEAAERASIGGTTHDRYEDMVEIARQDGGPDMLKEWWEAWRTKAPGSRAVPDRAHRYLARQRKAERATEKAAAKPIGPQGGPSPAFTPVDVPARASLATIDELRTTLAQWRGRARAVYTIVSTPEFMDTFERLLDDVVEISQAIQRIKDILESGPDGDEQ